MSALSAVCDGVEGVAVEGLKQALGLGVILACDAGFKKGVGGRTCLYTY